MPKNMATHTPLTTSNARPGMNSRVCRVSGMRKMSASSNQITMLWAKNSTWRHTRRYTWTESADGSCLIRPSLSMKTLAPSLMQPEMKPQTMKPTVTWGRNSATSI